MTKEKTKEEKTQDSSLNPEPGNPNSESEPKITNMFTHGSHGGIDDEYYINEIIGIDELPYEEFIKEGKKKEGSNE